MFRWLYLVISRFAREPLTLRSAARRRVRRQSPGIARKVIHRAVIIATAVSLSTPISASAAAGSKNAAEGGPPPGVIQHKAGTGARAAWVFVPENTDSARLPVVIFMHGYRALDPYDYGGWIDHLVRRGNIVIYPIYENTRSDDRTALLVQSVDGIKAALDYLKGASVMVDRSRFATVGHSLGGGMSLLLAARSAGLSLPPMRAVMPVQAGSKGGHGFPESVYHQLPDTLLMVVDGDRDQFADSRLGRAIVAGADGVAPEHKAYVVLQSDDRSEPALIADHYAPLCPDPAYRLRDYSARDERRQRFVKWALRIRDGEVDALDTEALWPLFDNLLEGSFDAPQSTLAEVLARTPGQGTHWLRRQQ